MPFIKSGYELRIYPNVSQRIYITDHKPYFLIELFIWLDIPELPEYPNDFVVNIEDWLILSLLRDTA